MSKIRIHVASDLHTNVYRMRHHHHRPIYTCPECDAVIFAGDMSEGMDTIQELYLHYPNKPVFWVSGNHEFYKHDITELRDQYQSTNNENVTCLDNSSATFVRDDRKVRIIGATLWTDYAVHPEQTSQALMIAARNVNDHRSIRNDDHYLSPYECKVLHEESVHFLDQEMSNTFDGDILVVSHHLPSRQSLDPRYYNSGLDPAFASDLDWLILKHQPVAWIHGHTHHSRDYHIGLTRVICNPRGYDWGRGAENPNWNPKLVLEI
jgi:Icc-related predicted phosphoesterase